MKTLAISAWLVLVLLSQFTSAGVLITKSGSRYTGKITEQDDSYILTKTSGGKMTFPKNMVKKVITSADLKAKFQQMRKSVVLTSDQAVEGILKYATETGLDSEKTALLSDAYAKRYPLACNKASSLRLLAKWCEKYSLDEKASECLLRANKLTFPKKLTDAGKDIEQLARLTEWCVSRNMPEEAKLAAAAVYAVRLKAAQTPQQKWKLSEWCDKRKMHSWRDDCRNTAVLAAASAQDVAALQQFLESLAKDKLSSDIRLKCQNALYKIRVKKAKTPQQKWELAEWCDKWRMQHSRDECRNAAILAAASAEDVASLQGFLDALVKDKASKDIMLKCRNTLYRIRLKRAGKDAMSLAQLTAWCEGAGMKPEAAKAENAALKLAPNNEKVRDLLGYVKDEAKGAWVKSSLSIKRSPKSDYYVLVKVPVKYLRSGRVVLSYANPSSKKRPDEIFFMPTGNVQNAIREIQRIGEQTGIIAHMSADFNNGTFDLVSSTNTHKKRSVYAAGKSKSGCAATYFLLSKWAIDSSGLLELPLPDSVQNGMYIPKGAKLCGWLVSGDGRKVAHFNLAGKSTPARKK